MTIQKNRSPHFFLLICSALIGFVTIGFGQTENKFTDTILLTNGKSIITQVNDTSNGYLRYLPKSHKTKTKKIRTEDVFSVKSKTGETIYYVYDANDSLSLDNYTVNEMRYFIAGTNDGRKSKFKTGYFLTNLIIGAGAGFTGSFFSPVLPFLSAGILTLPKPKLDQDLVSNAEYMKYPSYNKGFKQEAYRKRKIQTLLGGGVGLAIGLVANMIFKPQLLDSDK